MTPTYITCPHCKTTISLDEALTSDIHKQLEQSYIDKIQKQAIQLRAAVEKELNEKNQAERAFLQEQLEEQKQKTHVAQKMELELRKRELALEEKARAQDLLVARQLDEERVKLTSSIEQSILEKSRQKEQQKDKQIQDLQKLLDDAVRKANQGSQQTQGEVQELALEALLTETFPDDQVTPVGKGVLGADICQTVRSSRGTVCGILLWESKQTKNWSDGWIAKLKGDMRAQKADIAILVTSVYHDPHWSGIVQKDGVWICTIALAQALAQALRKSLLDVGREKSLALNKGEKSDLVYGYITSQSFRAQIESIATLYAEAKVQIDKERIAMEKIWKMREAQSLRLYMGIGSIYGTVQGLVGSSELPELPGMELLQDGI